MPGWLGTAVAATDPCAAWVATLCPAGAGVACTLEGARAVPTDGCIADLSGIDLTLTGSLDAAGSDFVLLAQSFTLGAGASLVDSAAAGVAIELQLADRFVSDGALSLGGSGAGGDAALGGTLDLGSYERGGALTVTAGGALTVPGVVDVSGMDSGGRVAFTGDTVVVDGSIDASGYAYTASNEASLTLTAARDLVLGPTSVVSGEGGYEESGAAITLASLAGDVALQGRRVGGSWVAGGPIGSRAATSTCPARSTS